MSTSLPGAVPWPADDARRWREAGYWTGETFTSMLAERAAAHPDRIALVDDTRRTSYRQLAERSRRLAAGLHRSGIRRQDRVILQFANVTEFFEACFALYQLRALPVFALPAHRSSELGNLIEQTGARGYLLSGRIGRTELRPLARQLLAEHPALRFAAATGPVEPADSDGMLALADCYADQTETEAVLAELEPPRAAEVAFLQLSGGSTGRPKLIPRTHEEYLYTLRESARICRLDADTRYLAVLPVAHNYPMSSPGCFGVFHAGGTVVLADSGDPETAFGLIERERITFTALVPPLALAWLTAAPSRPEDRRSLRVIQVGGAPFPAAAARRIRPELGATLQQVFGMAEGLVCYTGLDDPEEEIAVSQGRPISAHDELLVVDDEDRPVPPGTRGHLLTRGPYTIRGYYAAEEYNRQAFTADGFYRTGDLVSVSADRRVTVAGRAKDQINRGGEKIAVDEVENHLLTHPDVHDAAVVAVPDEVLGERSCAFLITRTGTELGRRAVATYLTERGVAAYKIPDRVVRLDAFPETGVGKTSRRELRAALSAGRLEPVHAAANEGK